MDDALDRIAAVAEDVLWPAAQDTDRAPIVPAANIDALRAAGAFAAFAPDGLSPDEIRRAHRILGGACGATYFVWVQHRGPATLLATTSNATLRDEWHGRIVGGDAVAGTAFAHLRRPGPPAVVATPTDDGGFVLDGDAPWATGWGIAAAYSVAAKTPDGSQVVWGLMDGRPQPGLRVSDPMALACMQATATVRFRFDGFVVPPGRVLAVIPTATWMAADDLAANRLNPAVLGVADRAISLLAPVDAAAASRLADRVDEVAAADVVSSPPDLHAMAEVRAAGLALAREAAHAHLAAVAGKGMDLGHPAQRLVREAAFYVIQAQTALGRAASLAPGVSPSSGNG